MHFRYQLHGAYAIYKSYDLQRCSDNVYNTHTILEHFENFTVCVVNSLLR
jgi:hypothetical protein